MESANPEEIKKAVRSYTVVFVTLLCLTFVTVAVSYLHLPRPQAITLALIIATVKASLVAAFFMHLVSEKKVIYAVLSLTAAFFVLVMLLPSLTLFTNSGHLG
jgi:cytochrome c oxidase subunit 4